MLTVPRWFLFSFNRQSNVSLYHTSKLVFYSSGSTLSCLLYFIVVVCFVFVLFLLSAFSSIAFVQFIDCQKFYSSNKISTVSIECAIDFEVNDCEWCEMFEDDKNKMRFTRSLILMCCFCIWRGFNKHFIILFILFYFFACLDLSSLFSWEWADIQFLGIPSLWYCEYCRNTQPSQTEHTAPHKKIP